MREVYYAKLGFVFPFAFFSHTTHSSIPWYHNLPLIRFSTFRTFLQRKTRIKQEFKYQYKKRQDIENESKVKDVTTNKKSHSKYTNFYILLLRIIHGCVFP